MSELRQALASFVPALVTRRLAEDPRPLTEPQGEIVAAAVLFADVSGFTALTEGLARQGPAGVEKVAAGLDKYFGRLIDITAAHGGDVVTFAGDALTAVWLAEGDLAGAAGAAVACGLAIQAALHAYPIDDGVELSLRIGVAAGHIALVHIGGRGGRWELVLAGTPIERVRAAEVLANPGEVVADGRVSGLLADAIEAAPCAEEFTRVIRATRSVPVSPLVRREPLEGAEEALRGYVPRAVAARLAAGQRGYIAELRRIAVLFINLPDMSHATALARAQEVMTAVQQVVDAGEGTTLHVSVDDHGATVLVAYGLPPLAHEDDTARAVEAGQQVRESLERLGWRTRCGIAAGRAFCGVVGSADRCEYTVLGDVVNLAARLMQAGTDRAILCDQAAYQAARTQFLFEGLPPITVKGKADAIQLYSPASARLPGRGQQRALSGPVPAAGGRPALVGRMRERVVLVGRLHEVLRGRSSTIVVEGEAGLGKSRLADDLLEQAEAAGAHRLVGAREVSEAAGAYQAWAPIFTQIFGLTQGTELGSASEQWQRVVARLRQLVPAAVPRAPLLRAVLPLDVADNDRTAPLQGRVRAEQTRALLVQLLLAHLKGHPAVLVLEDAQRLDSASWALLEDVRAMVSPLLVALITGPVDDTAPASAELREVLAEPETYHLQLQPLSLAETENLVCRRLGVTRLPAEVASFIFEKAEGHPFFSEELASALRDAGYLTIWNGECLLSPEAGDLRTAKFPDNLEAVITSRIDRLEPQHQLVLKVAAVLGRVFSLGLLRAIYPLEADKPSLAEYAAALERRGLIQVKPGAAEGTYSFRHAMTLEVAYGLLPFAQRQQLHQAVAEHFERAHHTKLELYYPLLAHHWYRVVASSALVPGGGRPSPELVGRAVLYLQKAGDQAIRDDVGLEAVAHYTHALELQRQLPESPERLEQEISLQIGLGNALIATRGFASDEVEQTFARARELCRAVGDTRHIFPVLFGLWQHALVRGQHAVARELAEQMLVFAEGRRQRVPLLVSHRAIGTQLFHQGDFGRARAHLERTVVLYAPDFDRNLGHLYIHDPRIAALSMLSLTLWMVGRTSEALERSRVAVGLARELGHGFSTAFALGVAAILRQILRDVDGARAHADAVIQLSAEASLGTWHGFAEAIRAWAMAELGQADEGADLLRQALVELQAGGTGIFLSWAFSVFADLSLRAGRAAEARGVVAEAIEGARIGGARWWEAELLRIRAEIAHAEGEAGAVAPLLAEALALAREQGARALELRIADSLVRLHGEDPVVSEQVREIVGQLAGKIDESELAALSAKTRGW